MKNKLYQSMYKKIHTSEEMDERIRNSVVQKKLYWGNYNFVGKAAVAVVVLTFILCLPNLQTRAMEMWETFSNYFVVDKGEDENSVIEMEGGYLALSPTATKKECKMDSIMQVSKNLGVSLLYSTQERKENNGISYYPHVSKKGVLNGVNLINNFYAEGPIALEIIIRSKDNTGVDYNNHELEYAGVKWSLVEGESISDIHLYEIPQLGVNAIFFTTQSEGPELWEEKGIEVVEPLTGVVFMYEGIEYKYLGAISQEEMKVFLNTLQK